MSMEHGEKSILALCSLPQAPRSLQNLQLIKARAKRQPCPLPHAPSYFINQ